MAALGNILIVLFCFGILFFGFKSAFRAEHFPGRKMDKDDQNFLEKNFKYYRELPPRSKKKFVRRINKFLYVKAFEGRQGLIVTKEMQLLISATAIRLTFGFYRDYLIDGLETIIIYPEQYYSTISKTYHKGETNSSGIIVLSWKDFMTSLKDEHNNINLGFHEFTHAMMIEGMFQWREAYEWLCQEIEYGHLIREIKHVHLLRDYAYTNQMEFISCVMETFFESPELIKKDVPTLYYIFVEMLKQDPLKIRYGRSINYV
jgi:MtfA peptidase